MDERLKVRLIGAAVLVALAVIFLPMLLEDEPALDKGFAQQAVPDSTLDQQGFKERALSLPSESGQQIEPLRPLIEPPPVFVPPRDAELTQSLEPPKQKPPKSIQPLPVEEQEPVTPQPAAGPAKVPAGSESWVVQVASLSVKDKADELVKELRALKYNAFLQEAKVGGKNWYRVRIGPDIDRKRLEGTLTAVQKLLAARNLQPQIVRYP